MTDKEEDGRLTPRPLTDTELDELEALEKDARPYSIEFAPTRKEYGRICLEVYGRDTEGDWPIVRLLPAATAAIPALLAEVKDGRRLLREAEDEVHRFRTALRMAHDAMVTWFSSEYADHPISRAIRETLDRFGTGNAAQPPTDP